MNTFEETEFLEDFLQYYSKAKKLQDKTIELKNIEETEIDDPLMWNVHIYDTVNRKYAGFSNVLQDLWHAGNSPKAPAPQYTHFNMFGNTLDTYLYLFLVHRITGSGASFEKDHGYRNTIIPYLVERMTKKKFRDKRTKDPVGYFADLIHTYEKPMFTSKGNQIPPFPKPDKGYTTGGKLYLCYYAPKLIADLCIYLRSKPMLTIRETLSWILSWHKSHGLKQYKFVLTAFVMDIAEYFPQFVDPKSPIHFGSNATKCVNIILPRRKGVKVEDWEEETMVFLCEKVNHQSTPMDMEDVCCDYVRYLTEYVAPEIKAELQPEQMVNNSLLKKQLGEKYYEFVREKTEV